MKNNILLDLRELRDPLVKLAREIRMETGENKSLSSLIREAIREFLKGVEK
jgi:hypothetical protein